jgi:hypothetical protein
LFWRDINFELRTVRVAAKPELGFYPKLWGDREGPAPAELITELQTHTPRPNCQFVFPPPTRLRLTEPSPQRCVWPAHVGRPSREGVVRHRVLVPIQPEPRPARGDHAVNRQQPFSQNGACNVQIFKPGSRRRDGHHMGARLDKGVV